MIESVSHLFSSTTCAATHVDGEGGESDLAPTDPDECPEACDVWGRQVTWSGQTEVSPSPRCCCAPCPCPPWW
jgi:hypothetical protein